MTDTRYPTATVVLRKGRSKPVVQRHPWVFSGAIAAVEGEPRDGDIVEVEDAGHNWLARGYFNTQSQIRVRILTWKRTERVDAGFWHTRLDRAITARRALGLGLAGEASAPITAYRIAHAESDYLPGLIVDRYDQWLVIQFLTAGMERQREAILEALVSLMGQNLRGIYERSDVAARHKEGLRQQVGPLWGERPPQFVEIRESGHRFLVDLREGHKTGFYLDQRENRVRLAQQSQGAEILDAFAFTGGFAVYAVAARASHVTMIDTSAPSLELARRNVALNSSDPAASARDPAVVRRRERCDYIEGDVFEVLRRLRSEQQLFDIVVLDPPKFAHTRREVDRAARAYKDINLVALHLVRPGGLLFTFSCSGRVSADLFQKIVFGASIDAGRRAQVIGRMSQGPDHPVALTFPEGDYLKGLVCRVW